MNTTHFQFWNWTYPEPFTHDFPRADIHELISSNILHQPIKGTFKDHLVTWVEEYLYLTHNKREAGDIMDEIDQRYIALEYCLDIHIIIWIQNCCGTSIS